MLYNIGKGRRYCHFAFGAYFLNKREININILET